MKCTICRIEEAVCKAKNHLIGGYYLLCRDCWDNGLGMAKISVPDVKPLEQEEETHL